ncbi:MAG: hypothetical protein HUJ29_02270, partial [Gammaproteobacteria bacterium]|nr:hypothetical protein [Gammaproteobacteria bacterium]
VVDTSLKEELPLEVVEKQVFGVDHNELLTRLLDEMRLPEMTFYAINGMTEMEELDMLGRDVDYHMAVLALAHHILNSLPQTRKHPIENMPDDLESLRDKLELSQQDLDDIIAGYQTERSDN